MSRQRTRAVLLYLGIVPALAAIAFAVMVLRVLALQHAGDTAYNEARYGDAVGRYHAAGHLNPFQDWLAAFDAGAAHHVAGEYAEAVSAYQAALALGVPHREQCTVRINLSLADEAIGDAARAAHRLKAADNAYRAAIAALEDGKCPTDAGRGPQQTKDGKAVDHRLHRKLQQDKRQAQQQKKRQQQRNHQTPQQRQRERQQRQKAQQQERQREQKLQRQNQQGLKDRNDNRDLQGGSGSLPNW